MLLGELCAELHKLRDSFLNLHIVDLGSTFFPFAIFGSFERYTASALDWSSLDEGLDIFIQSSEAWMTQGRNFPFLIDEDTERSLFCVEVEMQPAISILDVVVLEACVASFSDSSLLLRLVSVQAEGEEPDIARPFGLVFIYDFLELIHVFHAEFAGRGPKRDHYHLVFLKADVGQFIRA